MNPKDKDGKKLPPLIKRKRLSNGLCLYKPLAEAKTKDLHKFLVEEAVEHGVIPAIILHNIRKAALTNWGKRHGQCVCALLAVFWGTNTMNTKSASPI